MENSKKKIFIVGSHGHALMVIDTIEAESRYKIIGLLDPFKDSNTIVSNYKILGGQKDIESLSTETDVSQCIIAIGDNWDRFLVHNEICEVCPDMDFVSTIHPFSYIGKDVAFDDGTVVLPGAIINRGTQVGKFNIINTAASVDHECILEDFVSIAPGATLGGGVKIGKYSSISLGAKIIQKVTIGEHVVVGAGSVVLNDLPDGVIAYGTPARIIRKREVGEKYF